MNVIPFHVDLPWEEWFAWHPVKIKISKVEWKWFWLKRVERCWHGVTPDAGYYDYRLKESPRGK